MTHFFNKLSVLGISLLLGAGSLTAQNDQFVELSFTPEGKTKKETTKYVGEEAATFDVAGYINEHIDQGEVQVIGRLSTDLKYTRIQFDSKKVEDKDATFCKSVRTEVKPFIGVASTGMDDFSGVLLERIVDKSAAFDAAFTTGDVISYIDDYEIRSVCDLRMTVQKLEIGQEVMVTYDGQVDNEKKNMTVGSREFSYVTWKACDNQATAQVQVVSNEAQNQIAEHAYEIFPNPSVGLTKLTFEHASRGELSIEIFDLQGKRIYTQSNIDFDRYYEEELNITNQPSGIYLVELNLNGEQFTKELVIQNK